MRIRVTAVTVVSDGHGRRYRSGWEGDVPDELGSAWVAACLAVPAETPDEDPGTDPGARRGRTGKRTASRRAARTATPDE